MAVRDLVALFGQASQARSIMQTPWWPLDPLLYNGQVYFQNPTSYGKQEMPRLAGERAALTSNAIVYSVLRVRLELFAQGRFVFRRLTSSFRPTVADMFTTDALAPLDEPVAVLEQCEIDVACTGASFWVLGDDGLLRNLPAEWCTIVSGSNRTSDDPQLAWDARPVGLIYDPPTTSERDVFLWSEVGAYIPERDPDARWRGMSWLRPAMEDVQGDNGARRYLSKFWENNATPNTVVTFPRELDDVDTIREYRDLFLEKHQGVERSFRTGFIGGGADFKVLGSSMKDLDTEKVRTQVHKDIAAAAGVPIVAAGIEQGTYANSKESNRALADRKVRYLWRCAQRAFTPLIVVPSRSELWVDTSGISALQADALDDAQVLSSEAGTIRSLVEGGFTPESVLQAVTTGDLKKLKHSGLLSVQLQPPVTELPDEEDDGAGGAGG